MGGAQEVLSRSWNKAAAVSAGTSEHYKQTVISGGDD
jgi:hypothetical protein